MKTITDYFSLLRFCLPFLALAVTHAQEGRPGSDLGTLLENFGASTQTNIFSPYEKSVADLNASYATALDRALASAQQDGRLEEALAITAEKEAVTGGSETPKGEVKTNHGSLVALRETYTKAIIPIQAERDQKLTDANRELVKALDQLQLKLTQDGRLDDALVAKVKREEIEKQIASTSGQNGDDGKVPLGMKSSEAEDDDAGDSNKNERYFINKTWVSSARAAYSFMRDGEGERIHAGVKTEMTWKKRPDGIIEAVGSMSPDSPPRTWYFKFDNFKTALFGDQLDAINLPMTSG